MKKFTQQEKEAAAQLIKNMKMVEEIQQLACLTSDHIYEAVGEALADWCEKNSLYFESHKNNNYGDWFAEENWITDKENSQSIAWYYLNNCDDDIRWLTHFVGECSVSAIIAFEIDPALFENGVKSKPIWRKCANQLNDKYKQIETLGITFDPDEAFWFITFKLDAEELAEAFMNDSVVDALTPMFEALEKMKEAHPHFISLVEDAQTYYKNR